MTVIFSSFLVFLFFYIFECLYFQLFTDIKNHLLRNNLLHGSTTYNEP